MAQGKTGFFQQRKQQSHSRAINAVPETSSSLQTPKLMSGKYHELLQTPRSAQLALTKGEDDEESGYRQKHLNMTANEKKEEIPLVDSESLFRSRISAPGSHAHRLAATSGFVSRSESHLCGQKKKKLVYEKTNIHSTILLIHSHCQPRSAWEN